MIERAPVHVRLWHQPLAPSLNITGLLEDYRLDRRLTADPAWARRCAARAGEFLAAVGGRPAAITAISIRAYLARRRQAGAGARTLRNHLSAIRGFCRFLHESGILAADPCLRVTGPAPDECLPHFVHDDEIPLLLEMAERRGLLREVTLDLHTGLRMNELRLLRWMDWLRADRVLAIRKSKSKRPRLVPLNSEAMRILAEQYVLTGAFPHVFAGWLGPRAVFTDRPRGYTWWSRALVPIAAEHPAFARVPKGQTGRGWHLIRHTFATRLVRTRNGERGVDPGQLKDWMGHRSVNTTMIYAHFAQGYDPQIERLVEPMNIDNPPGVRYTGGPR